MIGVPDCGSAIQMVCAGGPISVDPDCGSAIQMVACEGLAPSTWIAAWREL